MHRLGRSVAGLMMGLGLLAAPALASARPEAEQPVGGLARAPRSLRERLGAASAVRLLQAPSEQRRLDGIRRLGELATPEAHAELVSLALDAKRRLGGREALTISRALADARDEPRVHLALSALMHRVAPPGAGPDELLWAKASAAVAALALAENASADALEVLARALRAGGPAAELASAALEAHPPERIDALIAEGAEPSVELARLLGKLGDQRTFHRLRDWVRGGRSPELRAAAALALTELGALETVPLARQWLDRDVPVLRAAGLRILLAAQQDEAAKRLLAELEHSELGAAERALLLEYPLPEFAPALREKLRQGHSESEFWWTLLGRIGEPVAADLVAGLESREHGFIAAHALSRARGAAGHAALSKALAQPDTKALSARAARLAEWLGAEPLTALPVCLKQLAESKSASDRAAAGWARSLAGSRQALEELESGVPERALSAANNALAFEPGVFEHAGDLLSSVSPGPLRHAFAFALLRAEGSSRVSSRVLRELVAEGDVASPLALRALASREEPAPGSTLDRYFGHPDPELRAHVARGIGDGRRAGAVGLLEAHYEFEIEPWVRHAILLALADLGGPRAALLLQRAARLEPDAAARAAARAAASGMRAERVPRGTESLWLKVARAAGGPRTGRERSVGLLSLAPGVSLPVFADGAGLIVVAGVQRGGLRIRVQ